MRFNIVLVASTWLVGCSADSFPWRMQDGPPPGPHDKALCPVTGIQVHITASTASLPFKNGQKLYFASQEAAAAYRKNPRAFLLSPFEMPVSMPDGARGLPDLRGSTLYCPYSNETISVGMKSVRVDHRYGQAVYFCCHGCFTRFWTDPQTAFATSEPKPIKGTKEDEAELKMLVDGPPPGPSDKAQCPVTGESISIAASTASLKFKNGQKLYFASQEAAAAYQKNPRAFLLSPFELPLPMPDGARGLPDLRGSTLYCPYSNETIDVGMKSVRVDHRYGQAVYFCCHGCFTRFWTDPQSAFDSGSNVLALV